MVSLAKTDYSTLGLCETSEILKIFKNKNVDMSMFLELDLLYTVLFSQTAKK